MQHRCRRTFGRIRAVPSRARHLLHEHGSKLGPHKESYALHRMEKES
jgi:hypothetical protein